MNIYHRIYKLYQRKIPAQQIAATTHMPIQSVREIIKRFDGKPNTEKRNETNPDLEPYLDYHISRHHKYTIIDFSGFLLAQFVDQVEEAIEEVRQQLGQTLAIKLDEVVAIDSEAMDVITSFSEELKHIAKNLSLLSPSDRVESYIEQHDLDQKLKIFGTLSAFEEHAFTLSHGK